MGKIGGFDSYKPESGTARALVKLSLAGAILAAVVLTVFYYGPVYSFVKWAPEQPIAFSHKSHAGENEIDCQYCHTYARRSEIAGIPSVSKCMNCHLNLNSDSPEIAKLTEYYDEEKPIEWVRVYDLPDHVWFSHKRHIAKDVECRTCHMAVETYEVQTRMINYRMKFCLDCHQENDASTDCWTCHT